MNDLSAHFGQIFVLIFIFLVLGGIIFFGLSTVVYKTQGEFFMAVKNFEHRSFLWIKRHYFKLAGGFIGLILVLVGVLIFAYLSTRPVVVSAEKLMRTEKATVDVLQTKTNMGDVFSASTEFIILDVRPAEKFYQGHLKGTVLVPYEDFKSGRKRDLSPARRVAVFSGKDNLKEAKEVANGLADQKMPKVYIIKDGYEGLVQAGWKESEKPCFECE